MKLVTVDARPPQLFDLSALWVPPRQPGPALGSEPRHHWMPGGTWAVRRTLRQMRGLVLAAKTQPAVREMAAAILHGVPRDVGSCCRAFQVWAQRNIEYRSDPRGVEYLQAPAYTLRIGIGDCDEFTTTICGLCESVGIRTRMVAIGTQPNVYSHVYPEARIGGVWVPMEATLPYLLGQLPKHVSRIEMEN